MLYFCFQDIYETKNLFFLSFSAWTNIYRSSKPCALSGLNPVALSGSTVCQDQCRRITALIRQHTSLSQLDFLSWNFHFTALGNVSWQLFSNYPWEMESLSYYSVASSAWPFARRMAIWKRQFYLRDIDSFGRIWLNLVNFGRHFRIIDGFFYFSVFPIFNVSLNDWYYRVPSSSQSWSES